MNLKTLFPPELDNPYIILVYFVLQKNVLELEGLLLHSNDELQFVLGLHFREIEVLPFRGVDIKGLVVVEDVC